VAIETEVGLEAPEGFKQTEIGPLPTEWATVRLGDIATARYGKAKPPSSGNVPVIGSGGVYAWADQCLVEFQTVIIGRKGTAGEIWVPKGPCWPSDTTFFLEWKTEVDVAFVASYLRLHKPSGQHAKTTLPSLQKHQVEEIIVPLPPLYEQRAIARVLSTIQRAIEATDRVIAAARQLKRSLMRHLFTYGPVPIAEAERIPLKETEIGPVPEHWEVVRLKDAAQKTSQVDPRRRPHQSFRYVDVSSVDNNRLRIMSYASVDGSNAPSRARKLVQTKDVIFATVRPYLKRIALVPPQLDGHICSTAFCVVRADPARADHDYLFFTVSEDMFVDRVAARQHGTGYPAVTDSVVLGEAIPLPPVTEQRAIAWALTRTATKIEAEEKRKAALKELFRTMLHLLMTGRTRVKDWNTSSAEGGT